MTQNPLLMQPFYTHPCDSVLEDHSRHVIVHQYVACIKVPEAWAVPSGMVWLSTPALVDVLVGSCLWHPDYGSFRVVAFDKGAQRIRVQPKSDAVVGTQIPSCSKFIFIADV